MPTYDYECQACGHAFEMFQSITAKPAKKCPECGKSKLERLIGIGGAVLFKGGGFYETDYRSESYQKAAKADADAAKPASEKAADSKSTTDSGSKSEATKPAGGKSESGSKKSSKPKGEKSAA